MVALVLLLLAWLSGFCVCEQDFPSGLIQNVRISSIESYGFRRCYDETYGTLLPDIETLFAACPDELLSEGKYYVLLAGCQDPCYEIHTGGVTQGEVFANPTFTEDGSYNLTNAAISGLYFYHKLKPEDRNSYVYNSVGFSRAPNVKFRGACDEGNGDEIGRLCWLLSYTGTAGGRSGASYHNTAQNWRKLVFYKRIVTMNSTPPSQSPTGAPSPLGPATSFTKCASDLPLDIPDEGSLTQSFIITDSLDDMQSVEVSIELEHDHMEDVIISVALEEAQESVTLMSGVYSRLEELDIIFSDAASEEISQYNLANGLELQPEEPLSAFDHLGRFDQNTWKLSINDTFPRLSDGTLTQFCISFKVPQKYVALNSTGYYGRARQFCAHHYGTDLAVMRNENDIILAKETCREACDAISDCDGCWVGLNDLVTQGSFEWIDGTPATVDDWAIYQPSLTYNGQEEHCGELWQHRDYQWNDRTCDDQTRIPLCDFPPTL